MYGREDAEFRVTFDENIRSRVHNLTLRLDDETEALLEPGYKLMEVKVSGAIPLWFVELLSKYEIYSTSFSKYGCVYLRWNHHSTFHRKCAFVCTGGSEDHQHGKYV